MSHLKASRTSGQRGGGWDLKQGDAARCPRSEMYHGELASNISPVTDQGESVKAQGEQPFRLSRPKRPMILISISKSNTIDK
nr:hypothetical transcript [Hymenolepis microstoma]